MGYEYGAEAWAISIRSRGMGYEYGAEAWGMSTEQRHGV